MAPLQQQPRPSSENTDTATRGARQFRPIAALAALLGVAAPATIALVEHGFAAWFAAAISAYVAFVVARRMRREHLALEGFSSTIATVTSREVTEGTEGGNFYSIRYRFIGPDGNEYFGSEKSQVELPQEGQMLPVSYKSDDPNQNLPMATFWFYRFTYTGFANWMN
jgi:hypothetical protein